MEKLPTFIVGCAGLAATAYAPASMILPIGGLSLLAILAGEKIVRRYLIPFARRRKSDRLAREIWSVKCR